MPEVILGAPGAFAERVSISPHQRSHPAWRRMIAVKSRKCRYCRREFEPLKPNYFYCRWACRLAHVGEHSERQSYDRQGRDRSYDQGFWDGNRARPSTTLEIPKGIWKGMLLLCHPDKYAQEPGLQTLAGEITRWLIDHRPSEAERN
jgi:hypothetical protein